MNLALIVGALSGPAYLAVGALICRREREASTALLLAWPIYLLLAGISRAYILTEDRLFRFVHGGPRCPAREDRFDYDRCVYREGHPGPHHDQFGFASFFEGQTSTDNIPRRRDM